MAKAQPTEICAPPLGLAQLSWLHLLIPGGYLYPCGPNMRPRGAATKGGAPESWFSTFDQSAIFTFVGLYGAGPVYEGGCVISAFKMALVVEKVASNILNSQRTKRCHSSNVSRTKIRHERHLEPDALMSQDTCCSRPCTNVSSSVNYSLTSP